MRAITARADATGVDDDATSTSWATLATMAASLAGTPCYVSRWRPVRRAVEAQERHFPDLTVRSWLSFKTHPAPPLAHAWLRSGRGVEVVSEAEFVTIRALNCPTSQLLVNGVAKHTWLGKYAVADLHVHLDSIGELQGLLPTATALRWRVGLRCHVPDERDRKDPGFGGQFGLSADEVDYASACLHAAGLRVHGLHFHLEQNSREPGAYAAAFDHVVAASLRSGLAPTYLDCGGGIDGSQDVAATFAEISQAFHRAVFRLPTLRELWLENGRFLTRASAALVIRVIDRKQRDECCYLICDGGRTNHALDADNGAHALVAIPDRRGDDVLTTICGPTCMTDDRLARVMLPASVGPGDLIVWFGAGAYHLPWETRFSQGLSAVVWADEHDALSVVRAHERPEEWRQRWTVSA